MVLNEEFIQKCREAFNTFDQDMNEEEAEEEEGGGPEGDKGG